MAGIGFELQKLLKRRTLAATLQAFFYGSMVASGPMVLTVITVSLIGWMSRSLLSEGELRLFTLTITYTFAFSLILTAPFQQLLTRYIADKHFAKELDDLFAGFVTSTLFVLALALLASGIFYGVLRLTVPLAHERLYRIAGVVLFLGQCFIWQLMAFISTSKEYQKILWAYILGAIASLVAAYLLLPRVGIVGALAGYGVGQWLIALVIFWITTRRLKKWPAVSMEFFSTFPRYPIIALNGFFITLGVWVDKFVFYACTRQTYGGDLFYSFNFYDVPNFLSLMTLIPGMAYFLIMAETNFYRDFKKFIEHVLEQPLSRIEQIKKDLVDTLHSGMIGMARVQGIFSLILIILAVPLVIFLGYQGLFVPLFRTLCVAAFFYILMLTLNVFYLYFEFRKQALVMSLLFCFGNAGLTYLSYLLGTRYYGLGFLLSSLITLAIFWPRLIRQVKRIDYIIFASQPIDDAFERQRKSVWKKWLDRTFGKRARRRKDEMETSLSHA